MSFKGVLFLCEINIGIGLEQSYNCDAKTEVFHGISQTPETMYKQKEWLIWWIYRSTMEILKELVKKKMKQLTE